MSQARRHAAPRSTSHRKAPKESWTRRVLARRTAATQPDLAPEPPEADAASARPTVAQLPLLEPASARKRSRRAGWVPPEDLAEAPVLVTGESVHLPGVFRLDGGRKSWLAGLDEAPRPAGHLVEAPLAPAPVFVFPPEVDVPAEPLPLPQQARAARHARVH